MGILSGCGGDPAIALRLRNAADYRLPTSGPHGTKLGHSWFDWKLKIVFSGWFDISKKGDVSGQCEWMWVWSSGCTPPQECWRLPPTYFWTTWNQTRAFLISLFPGWIDNLEKGDVSGHFERLRDPVLTILKMETCLGNVSWCGCDPAVALRLSNAAYYLLPTFGSHGTKIGHAWYQWIIKCDLSGWFDNSEKGEVSGHFQRLQGWSRGCTPPQECCRLPPTYFWATWHQTRAFLISVNNKSDFSGRFDNSKKGDVSGHCERLQGWSCGFHSASRRLQTTAYLLLGHMAPN